MEPIRKSIYQLKVAPKGQKPNFMTVDEGVKRVQKDFFAFHVELSSAYKMIGDIFQENEKCGLKEIEFVSLVDPHMTLAKNSEFKEIFRTGYVYIDKFILIYYNKVSGTKHLSINLKLIVR